MASWFFKIAFLLFSGTCAYAYQKQMLDSLSQSLSGANGVVRIDILNRLSESYQGVNAEKSLEYAREAIRLSGIEGDNARLAISNINAGAVYRNIGQTNKALDYFMSALSEAESMGNKNIQAEALHKIGVTYLLVNEFDDALEYGRKEEEIWRSINDKPGLANAYNLIGLVCINLNKMEEASEKLLLSLQMAKEINDKNLLYKPLVNLGDLYLKWNEPQKAVEYIQQSREISHALGNKFGEAVALLKLGTAFAKMGKYDLSHETLAQSLAEAQQLRSLSLVRNSFKELAEVNETSGNFKEALTYYRRYISTEDSMISEITKRRIAETVAKYEIENKDNEIMLLTKESEYSRYKLFLVGVLLGVSIIMLWLLYTRYKMRVRSEVEMKKINQEIISQNNEILKQREVVQVKSQQIERALEYAQRLQQSLLPDSSSYLNILGSYFIINKPKGTLSGDFYWYTYRDNNIIFVVADCTEHDIQGAFNTIIFGSLITQIINDYYFMTPADILKELNKRLANMLKYQEDPLASNVGIDMAIFSLNINTKRLVYAGAKIPLYLVNENGLHVFPADKYPIGSTNHPITVGFSNRTINLKKGDKVYVFTDGFQNQFGGPYNGKFLVKNLRDLIQQVQTLPLSSQKKEIEQSLSQWQGDQPQTDDILALGIQI